MVFRQLARALVGTLGELGVKRIVTCDPHALNSLRNEYPEFGLDCEVIHHTRLIADLLADGRIEVDASLERVIYHDPCYLGRHNGEFDAPRAILARLGTDAPLEFALAREKSMCCGAGGGRMWIDETIGKRINIARVEQALEASPRTIATACPYCAVMVADGLSALRPDGGDSVARHRRTGRRCDEVDAGACRVAACGTRRGRVLTRRCRAASVARRRRCDRTAFDQVQDRLVREAGLLRQADLAGAAARIAARAVGRQRRLQVAQRMLVELGPDEAALAGEAAALHLVGGHDMRRCSGPRPPSACRRCPSCARCKPDARRSARLAASTAMRGSTRVVDELDAVLDRQPAGQELLHAVGARAGVEHDRPAAAFAGVAQRRLELGRFQVGCVDQSLALERLAAAQAGERHRDTTTSKPARSNSRSATTGSGSTPSWPRCAPMLRAAQLGK